MFLPSLILTISASSAAHAKDMSLGSLNNLSACLEGKMSQDVSSVERPLNPHGSLFTLDQRRPDLMCPSPKKNSVAWTRTINGPPPLVEIHILHEKEGKVVHEAFRIKMSEFRSSRTLNLQVPESSLDCGNLNSIQSLSGAKPPPLTIQIEHVELDALARTGNETHRFSLQQLTPSKETSLLTPSQYVHLDAGSEKKEEVDGIYADLLKQLARTWSTRHACEFIVDSDVATVRTHLEKCKAALTSIKTEIPSSNTDALIAHREALDSIQSAERLTRNIRGCSGPSTGPSPTPQDTGRFR